MEGKMRYERLVLPGKERLVCIRTKEITYIEAYDHAVVIHCVRDSFMFRGPLKRIEEKLNGRGFVRVHRSFIVSLDHIRKIEDGEIELDDLCRTKIVLGDGYKEKVIKEMQREGFIFL